MANYKENYITLEEYYAQQQMGIPYEGFVVGLGYVYSKGAVIMPPNQLGGAPAINTPASMNHFMMCTEEEVDTSQYAKEKSYMQDMTVERISQQIITDNPRDRTITVNVCGTLMTIPKKSSSVQINVEDTGSSIEVSVKAKNTATGEQCSKKCRSLHEFVDAIANPYNNVLTTRTEMARPRPNLPNLEGATGASIGIGRQAGKWAEDIMNDRNRYKAPGFRYSPKNLNPIVRFPIVNAEIPSRVMYNLHRLGKVCRLLGRVCFIADVVQIIADISEKKWGKVAYRVGVMTVAYGVSCIPYVGWFLAIGVGIVDAVYGDDIYDWLEHDAGSWLSTHPAPNPSLWNLNAPILYK